MEHLEDLRKMTELRIEMSDLQEREAALKHQLNITKKAIEAFGRNPCEVKVPLSTGQTSRIGKYAGYAKQMLPVRFSLGTMAVEQLAKLVFIRVAYLPILKSLRGDLQDRIKGVQDDRLRVRMNMDFVSKET